MKLKYVILCLVLNSIFSACTLPKRLLIHNVPSIKDQKHFSTTLVSSREPTDLKSGPEITLPQPDKWVLGKRMDAVSISELMEQSNTVAFLICRDNQIIYESYYNGYDREEQVLAFSATKVIISSLLYTAISAGHIKGLDQKVSDFYPIFSTGLGAKLEIRHLLNMTSGLNHDEYGKLFQTLVTYYHPNLEKRIAHSKFEHVPGEKFVYKSIDFQVLGRCIEKASGSSIDELIRTHLWDKIGGGDILLTRDSKGGSFRMFGGMALRPMDLIKIGLLYSHGDNFRNPVEISDLWINSISKRDLSDIWWGYRYGWWRDTYIKEGISKDNDFFASGFGGQCMLVDPENNTVILRLGENKGGVIWHTSLSKLSHLINNENQELPKKAIEFSGVYISENDPDKKIIIREKEQGNKWICKRYMKGKRTEKVTLIPYCDKSIYNSIKLVRIISHIVNGQEKGIIYDDNLTTPVLYKRSQ